jgi:hypothetical protein
VTPSGAVRTRLWSHGVLQAENFPLPDVAKNLGAQGALVWVDLCNPDPARLTNLGVLEQLLAVPVLGEVAHGTCVLPEAVLKSLRGRGLLESVLPD